MSEAARKDLRDTIALEVLKARIGHHGIAFSEDGNSARENMRMHVNDAFCYADEFLKQSGEAPEPYDWDGTDSDRTVNRKDGGAS